MPQTVKNLPAMQEIRVQSLGREDPLEKEMATHSRILTWGIPRTEESYVFLTALFNCEPLKGQVWSFCVKNHT